MRSVMYATLDCILYACIKLPKLSRMYVCRCYQHRSIGNSTKIKHYMGSFIAQVHTQLIKSASSTSPYAHIDMMSCVTPPPQSAQLHVCTSRSLETSKDPMIVRHTSDEGGGVPMSAFASPRVQVVQIHSYGVHLHSLHTQVPQGATNISIQSREDIHVIYRACGPPSDLQAAST